MAHKLIAKFQFAAFLATILLVFTSAQLSAQSSYAPAGNEQPGTMIPTHDADNASLIDKLKKSPAEAEDHAGHDHSHGHNHSHAAASQKWPILDKARHDQFARDLDLTAFKRLSSFESGRAKIVDTVAREYLSKVYGKPRWKDLDDTTFDPTFTFLDMWFNKSYYFDKPTIYIDVLGLRREVLSHLPVEDQEKWLKLGRVEPLMLANPQVRATITKLSADIMMTNALNQLNTAAATFDQTDAFMLMISPAPGGQYWSSLAEIVRPELTAPGSAKAQGEPANIDPARADAVKLALVELRAAWLAADATRANAALNKLCEVIPAVHPETYPSATIRSMEYYYNKTAKFTIGYVAYLFATIIFLAAFVGGRKWLLRAGVVLLFTGLGIHSLGILVRAALSGRWPIHNQYESYIFISWVAVLIGTVMMLYRKQWLFGAAAAALGTGTLLLANTYDIPSKEVGQVAAILATSRILYIHVNMVLVSYGLIALGFLLSVFYLVVHYTQGRGIVQYAKTSMGAEPELVGAGSGNVGGSTGSASGSASSALSDDENAEEKPGEKAGLLREIDHAQLVVFQLAFYILGVGILLGAYWADHAWGRWWAWDPKETWALITWIVYLIVIHVRFGVKNRGLTTAWLGVIGFFVMLWCYWGVNMLLAGLHSYA